MKEMRILNEEQYDEFAAYFMGSCAYQPHDELLCRDTFLSEPNQQG
jgi:hypothetical protein